MYVTMLDASIAFDKINHSKLIDKLIDRGYPAFIVRMYYVPTCIAPIKLPSDVVRAFLAVLLFQMVLNRVVFFSLPFQNVHP